MNYKRNIDELEKKAVLWWPQNLSEIDSKISVIPTLLMTQEEFLTILTLSNKDPFQVISVLKAAKFPINLFIKHLCVLADYGGEPLQRLGRSFEDIFPKIKGKRTLEFTWEGKLYTYVFKALPVNGLGNKKLKIDGEGLSKKILKLEDLHEDIIMLLIHGAASSANTEAGLENCEIGSLLGKADILNNYVKQRYILVSRITGGATANSLGQLAQKEVIEFLQQNLGKNYSVSSNKTVQLKGYNKNSGMPFDIVIEKGGKIIGIELSFQVTTNSTIERKAGQATDRMKLMNKNGYHIAYILDGAGNFQRRSAISTICKNSECTVAFTQNEFQILCNWIKSLNA